MAKLKRINPIEPGKVTYVFGCPGCRMLHQISTERTTPGPTWQFDSNLEEPTISPSILVRWPKPRGGEEVCHSFVRDRKIEFLSDCTHDLAGKTVDLPPV